MRHLAFAYLLKRVEQGNLTAPQTDKLGPSVYLYPFNPPVSWYFSFEAAQKSYASRPAHRVELDRHLRIVLAGDLQLEEIASINSCRYEQLLFFIEIALVDQSSLHWYCFYMD